MKTINTAECRELTLTKVDELDERDFDMEVEALSRNREFMAFLEQRSRESRRIPLAQAKKRLGLD
jgi:hypothetical protein